MSYTVNALYAMDQRDVEGFKSYFAKLGKNYNDTVTVSSNGLPKNPYISEQPKCPYYEITFLNLVKHEEKDREPLCTNLLLEEFAPDPASASDHHETSNTVEKLPSTYHTSELYKELSMQKYEFPSKKHPKP